MSRIFISHSHIDNAAALAVGGWLDEQGWSDYYLDIDNTRGTLPGERWLAALMQAVERCEAVLFLVSPAWRDSKYCLHEFLKAKELGKRIFGVIVQPIALSDLPLLMTAEWQVCDLTFDDDSVSFSVAHVPVVPPSVVRFPRAGLERLALGLRSAGLDALSFPWPPQNDPVRSPYRGLSALNEQDAAVFFGRDAAIVRAIDQLRLIRERGIEQLFVILGASGAGKSSFLRAGLLPRLRRDSDNFVVLPTLRLERAALSGQEGLLAILRDAYRATGRNVSLGEVRAELAAAGLMELLSGLEMAGRHGTRAALQAPRTVVLPIDQFEELFSTDGGPEAQSLLVMLEGAVAQAQSGTPTSGTGALRLLIIATIRSDSLQLLQAHPSLRQLAQVLTSLPAMPRSEFRAVIEGPARRHSEMVRPLIVEPALAEALIADAEGPDALPLLALTLELLYVESENSRTIRLSLDRYRAIGGVRGVIGNAVDRALARPADAPTIPHSIEEQTRLLQRIFPHLATVEADSRQTKRRVALRATIRQEAPQADAMVARLVQQRLLVTDIRSEDGSDSPLEEVVEVAHEALLRQWDALENWLRIMVSDLAAVEDVRREARSWQQNARHDDLLLHTRDRLRRAQALMTEGALQSTFEAKDKAYLDTCAARDDLLMTEQRLAEQRESFDLTRRAVALVWAGSRGSGLGSLTEHQAKPALDFGGKFRLIDFTLSNCVNSGIRRIGVVTQYKSHNLFRHLQHGWMFLKPELNEFLDLLPAAQQRDERSWYRGTADAAYYNWETLLRFGGARHVLFLAGDQIYKQNYALMLADHVKQDAECTLGCIEMKRGEASAFDVVTIDTGRRIVDIAHEPAAPNDIPGKPGRALVSMGNYIFNAEYLFSELERDMADPASSHDIARDIVPMMVRAGLANAHMFDQSCVPAKDGIDPYWRNIPTVDAYWDANLELTVTNPLLNLYDADWPVLTYQEQLPAAKFKLDRDNRASLAIASLVSEGCIVSGTVCESVLFQQVRVHSFAQVNRCVLLPGVEVGRNARLSHAIFDRDCEVPDDMVIGENPAQDAERFDRTASGIVLVTREALKRLG